MAQVSPLIDALFRHVATKGAYSQSDLAALGADHASLMPAIDALCSMSDLFQYDHSQACLVTTATYQPLNVATIVSHLPLTLRDRVTVKCTFMTDSTNTDLEKIAIVVNSDGLSDLAVIAVTEMQQGGRGRRAKKWVSPLAKNLYFSFKYHFPQSALPHLSSLSLRAGFVLLEALAHFGIENGKIKWPNDIWVKGQKLAGILVESTVTSRGIDLIIGIGVNNQQDQFAKVIGNHPTNCEAILGQPLDRNALAATLTQGLYQICQKMVTAPAALPNLHEQWAAKSCFFGKTVRLISDQGEEMGQEIGIDDSGALLIQYADGSIKRHLSGDLSLRAY